MGRECRRGNGARGARTRLGDDGNEIGAHSALRTRHSALERLFSGIHFGMDDWGNPRRRPKHQEGCEPQRAQIQRGGEGVEEAHGVFRPDVILQPFVEEQRLGAVQAGAMFHACHRRHNGVKFFKG